MIELTEEQRQTVLQGNSVRLTIPELSVGCVLLPPMCMNGCEPFWKTIVSRICARWLC